MNQPFSHGRPRYFNAQTIKYLLLAIKRQAVGKLGDGDVCQKTGGGVAFGDQLHRGRGNLDAGPLVLNTLATLAGVFITDMAFDSQPGGNVIELFADLFAKTG